jgi:hypothetical protein
VVAQEYVFKLDGKPVSMSVRKMVKYYETSRGSLALLGGTMLAGVPVPVGAERC